MFMMQQHRKITACCIVSWGNTKVEVFMMTSLVCLKATNSTGPIRPSERQNTQNAFHRGEYANFREGRAVFQIQIGALSYTLSTLAWYVQSSGRRTQKQDLSLTGLPPPCMSATPSPDHVIAVQSGGWWEMCSSLGLLVTGVPKIGEGTWPHDFKSSSKYGVFLLLVTTWGQNSTMLGKVHRVWNKLTRQWLNGLSTHDMCAAMQISSASTSV